MASVMSSSPRLILLDLDGTLLNSYGYISERNKSVVARARERGVVVTLASGRIFNSMLPFAEELALDTPIVTSNGSWIRNPVPPQETIEHMRIQKEVAIEVLNIIREHGIHANVYVDGELIVEVETDFVLEYSMSKKLPYKCFNSFEESGSLTPTKILAIDSNEKKILALKDAVNDLGEVDAFLSNPDFCEILPKGINKGWALERLCGYHGIDIADTVAFGDHENDISMIEKAGIGVGMGNAIPEVKEAADLVAPDNDEDGVAKILESLL